ncbi:MAG: rod shape-determining protein MreC [Peptostreptococcaceae bacterium]
MRFENNNKKKRLDKKVVVTSVVAITLIGIVGISIGSFFGNSGNISIVSDPINFIQQNLNQGFIFLKDSFSDIINFREHVNTIDELKLENDELKNEVISLQSELNKTESLTDLKKALNFIDEEYTKESISATIVSKNDGNWYTSFTVGAGLNDGVKKNSVVVNGNGLVGVVYEVTNNYSKAISILDTKASVSFKTPNNPDFKGVITQNANISDMETYKNDGYLYGYMFDTSYEVLPGDIIVTSGLGIYPEDILVGEIHKVIDDKNQSMKYVIIKPYVDLKNINDVMIIQPRPIGE